MYAHGCMMILMMIVMLTIHELHGKKYSEGCVGSRLPYSSVALCQLSDSVQREARPDLLRGPPDKAGEHRRSGSTE
ncbi:hypothetical protein BC826DRAFT_993942 [Russula brevipes]|nr:hypothetical protein BC826DRAFT_993942 [Russula brevipes]